MNFKDSCFEYEPINTTTTQFIFRKPLCLYRNLHSESKARPHSQRSEGFHNTLWTKIPRMPPGSKFTPPVIENPGLTSSAEVVVSDYTISCSLPGVAGAQIVFWEPLAYIETQTVHLSIRAVSTASWQEREQLLTLGREPLAEPGPQGLGK